MLVRDCTASLPHQSTDQTRGVQPKLEVIRVQAHVRYITTRRTTRIGGVFALHEGALLQKRLSCHRHRRPPFPLVAAVPIFFAVAENTVGHVLVFSFIQRFFPNFFPSTYTDRRQNLLKMYTEVEKKVTNGPRRSQACNSV